ncbi:MAG: hypothetical protein WCF81_00765, partial [Roseiarcus sp.]
FEHGSVLGGKTRGARVSSQWKSTLNDFYGSPGLKFGLAELAIETTPTRLGYGRFELLTQFGEPSVKLAAQARIRHVYIDGKGREVDTTLHNRDFALALANYNFGGPLVQPEFVFH